MDEVTKMLTSPVFWVCSVIAGLLINWTSAYTKPLLDKLLSKIFTKWHNRSKAKQKEYEQKIQKLMFDSERQDEIYKSTVRKRLQGIQFTLMGVGLFIIVNFLKPPTSIPWIDIPIAFLITVAPLIAVFSGIKEWFGAIDDEILLAKVQLSEMDKEYAELVAEKKRLEAKEKSLEKNILDLLKEKTAQ